MDNILKAAGTHPNSLPAPNFGWSSSSPLNSRMLFSRSILTLVHFLKSKSRSDANRITCSLLLTFLGQRIGYSVYRFPRTNTMQRYKFQFDANLHNFAVTKASIALTPEFIFAISGDKTLFLKRVTDRTRDTES